MTITLAIFLYLFYAFLAVFALFFLINVRDIFMSHAINLMTFGVTALVLLASIITVGAATQKLGRVDWQEPLFTVASDTFRSNSAPAF